MHVELFSQRLTLLKILIQQQYEYLQQFGFINMLKYCQKYLQQALENCSTTH